MRTPNRLSSAQYHQLAMAVQKYVDSEREPLSPEKAQQFFSATLGFVVTRPHLKHVCRKILQINLSEVLEVSDNNTPLAIIYHKIDKIHARLDRIERELSIEQEQS